MDRRRRLASLLVAVLAVTGAFAVPSAAAASSRLNAPVVWAARDQHPAKVGTGTRPIRWRRASARVDRPRPAFVLSAPVRHALFQRPPPILL